MIPNDCVGDVLSLKRIQLGTVIMRSSLFYYKYASQNVLENESFKLYWDRIASVVKLRLLIDQI